jgi:hypothetical protein
MAQRPKNDPRYYFCPNCGKGVVDFIGKDLRKLNVCQCNKCDRKIGEDGLERATHDRARED